MNERKILNGLLGDIDSLSLEMSCYASEEIKQIAREKDWLRKGILGLGIFGYGLATSGDYSLSMLGQGILMIDTIFGGMIS